MKETVKNYVVDLLTEKLNLEIDKNKVTYETPLTAGELKLESMAVMELVVNIEGDFNIKIPDEDLNRIVKFTLSDLANYISERVA